MSPSKTAAEPRSEPETQISPSKNRPSPTRSSFSANGRYSAVPQAFDPELGTWSEDDEIKPVEANIVQLLWITPPKCKDAECIISRHDDLSEFQSIGDSDDTLSLP